MKKFFLTLIAVFAFAVGNAMEQRYQGDQNQAQDHQHYTLAELRDIPAHLATLGLQQGQGYSANQLLGRYHDGLESLTPEEARQRYQAFSVLYPHSRQGQEVEQQTQTNFFDPNSYNYQNYYGGRLEEEYSHPMEIDEPNYLEEVGNSFSNNPGNHLFENVAPRLPNDAIVTNEDLQNRIREFANSLQDSSHPLYAAMRRPVIVVTGPSLLTVHTQHQTSQTVETNSDNPDLQRIVGGYTVARGIQVMETPVTVSFPNGTQIRGRFRRTHRSRTIDLGNNDERENDNDGGDRTGTGN
ncbi:MAG: hypothetical protein ACYCU7_19065 [Acidimicrobiales bacterium]